MTKFEQLESLYKQFFNLADEIESLVEDEEYNEALSRLQYKDSLIKKLALIKKTVEVDNPQLEKMLEMEKNLIKREKENIETLKSLKDNILSQMHKTKHNINVNNAYKTSTDNQGAILDFKE